MGPFSRTLRGGDNPSIEMNKKGKIQSLKEAGVHVVDRPDELGSIIKRLIQSE